MSRRAVVALVLYLAAALHAAQLVEHPFLGITYIRRTETNPRTLSMHIVEIDLRAQGIRFKLTPPDGALETVRQTTLDFLKQQHAQVAINAHYFLSFPSKSPEANLIGFAASGGVIYSAFEKPEQSYAIVAAAPAINIDSENHASAALLEQQLLVRRGNGKDGARRIARWRHTRPIFSGSFRRKPGHDRGRSR